MARLYVCKRLWYASRSIKYPVVLTIAVLRALRTTHKIKELYFTRQDFQLSQETREFDIDTQCFMLLLSSPRFRSGLDPKPASSHVKRYEIQFVLTGSR